MDFPWKVEPVDVGSAVATDLLVRYYQDIIGRYHGRAATRDEVRDTMRDESSDDLSPPSGLFLVGRWQGRPRACAGLRLASPETAQVTCMFVDPAARGRGGGGVVLTALQRHARDLGITTLRLDTRHDLVEARNLYLKHGFREVPAFNRARYAEHWFEKHLR